MAQISERRILSVGGSLGECCPLPMAELLGSPARSPWNQDRRATPKRIGPTDRTGQLLPRRRRDVCQPKEVDPAGARYRQGVRKTCRRGESMGPATNSLGDPKRREGNRRMADSEHRRRRAEVVLVGAFALFGVVESRTGAPALGSGGGSGAFAPGLSPAPVATFPVPAHQTGRADFPHPAFGRDHAFALGRPIVCRVR